MEEWGGGGRPPLFRLTLVAKHLDNSLWQAAALLATPHFSVGGAQ
jgi:hypothetical protein